MTRRPPAARESPVGGRLPFSGEVFQSDKRRAQSSAVHPSKRTSFVSIVGMLVARHGPMESHDPLTAERLFERYFWPLYPDDAKRDLERARRTDANPAGNVYILRTLDEITDTFVGMAGPALCAEGRLLYRAGSAAHRRS